MKKIFTIAACAALATLAACSEKGTDTVEVPADEAAAATAAASDEATDSAETAAAGSVVAPVGQQHQL